MRAGRAHGGNPDELQRALVVVGETEVRSGGMAEYRDAVATAANTCGWMTYSGNEVA